MVKLVLEVVELAGTCVADGVRAHALRVSRTVDDAVDVLQARPLAQVALLHEHRLVQRLQTFVAVGLEED